MSGTTIGNGGHCPPYCSLSAVGVHGADRPFGQIEDLQVKLIAISEIAPFATSIASFLARGPIMSPRFFRPH